MPRRYDVEKLTGRNDLANDFEVKLGGAFAPLLDLDAEDVETMYNGFKEATNSTTERTVVFQKREEVEGLPRSIEEACEQRRRARIKMVSNPLRAEKRALYKAANKVVKAAMKAPKQKALECKIKQLELDHKHNSHNLFRTVRELEGKPRKPMSAVKEKQGNIHKDNKEVLKCCDGCRRRLRKTGHSC